MKAPIWPFSHWTKVPTLRLNRGGCLIHSEQCPVLAQSGRWDVERQHRWRERIYSGKAWV
jgi:hypothetical protein